MKTLVLASVCAFTIVGAVHAATITVRRDGTGDFTTIQPAVDAAAPGDTINIGSGEYTEYQIIRPPLWDRDIDIYVYVTTDNLTIIGAGPSETVVGPPEENIDDQTASPQAIWAGNVNSIRVCELSVRNCYTGVYGSRTTTQVNRVVFDVTNLGVFVYSQNVEVDNCGFAGFGIGSKAVAHLPGCLYSRIRSCDIRDCSIYLETVEDFYIGDCAFRDGRSAVSMLDGSIGIIERCTVTNVGNVSFNVDGSQCTMRDVEITGGSSGFWMQGGELTATGITVAETTNQAFLLYQPIEFVVHASNILPSSGFAMKFESYSGSPSETYNCTGNYWGVADSTAIAELIWDGHDLPTINDYIGFVPFENQLEVERTTMGTVKSLFR